MSQFENHIPEQQEETINFREIYERYIVYWKWIVASAALFLLLGYLYNRKQPNVYQLETSVLVVDQARSGGMNEMSMLRQLDLVGTGSNMFTMVNNENEVLRSTTLMKKVVEQLELHTTYHRTQFLKRTELYTSSPVVVRMDSMSMVQLQGRLSLTLTPRNGGYHVKGDYLKEHFTATVNELPTLLNTPAGPVSISLRSGFERPDYPIEVSLHSVNSVARYLSTKVLTTNVAKQVDVIQISVKVSHVQKGKDLLNTLVLMYNQDAINQLNRSANNTKLFIDERLVLLSDELSEVERDVEDYKQVNELTDISVNAQMMLQRNEKFDQQRLGVETQLSLVRFIEEFIANPANHRALIPNLGLTDPGLVAVITSYNEYLMTRERVSGGTAEENPTLQNLNRQIETARGAIGTSIAMSRKGMEIQLRDLNQQYQLGTSNVKDLPRQEREFIEIKRQQQVKESLYVFLLQKREEASLTTAVTLPKGRVLNTPDSAAQVGPRYLVNMAIFLLLGILLPIAVVFIRDLINTTVNSRSQIEKLSKVPVLSELGHNDSGEVVIKHGSQSDSNAELFRLLRTKLQFTLDYPRQKTIMVTSTQPGEGKSYVSINLAISLSIVGKKVMLLGLDLRKPQLKKHLNLKNEAGMSAYLSGQEPDYRKLVEKVEAFPHLDVIAAGIIPPNPNELLMHERLAHLVEELRDHYDYIVMDTAPVGAVSDTFLIDRVTDISLYIVRMDYSDKRNLDYLNHVFEDKTLKRPYIVINDMDMENKYYYHRGYSYGYGKYYGQQQKKKHRT